MSHSQKHAAIMLCNDFRGQNVKGNKPVDNFSSLVIITLKNKV